MIVIIDYGMGNLRSVQKGFERLKVESVISNNQNEIKRADKLVLPGVGHFKEGMNRLKQLELIDILNEEVLINKKPILGICLGMQLFSNFSEEGNCSGLGWLDAETKAFNFSDNTKLKIPHMGWNTINKNTHKKSLISHDNKRDSYYFVHSYYMECYDDSSVALTEYGISFTSAVIKNNIYGVQFHPEKSHSQGLAILKKYSESS